MFLHNILIFLERNIQLIAKACKSAIGEDSRHTFCLNYEESVSKIPTEFKKDHFVNK